LVLLRRMPDGRC